MNYPKNKENDNAFIVSNKSIEQCCKETEDNSINNYYSVLSECISNCIVTSLAIIFFSSTYYMRDATAFYYNSTIAIALTLLILITTSAPIVFSYKNKTIRDSFKSYLAMISTLFIISLIFAIRFSYMLLNFSKMDSHWFIILYAIYGLISSLLMLLFCYMIRDKFNKL